MQKVRILNVCVCVCVCFFNLDYYNFVVSCLGVKIIEKSMVLVDGESLRNILSNEVIII